MERQPPTRSNMDWIETMKLSQRDKLLVLLLPSIVVLAVYGVFFGRGRIVECNKAAAALVKAKADAPQPAQRAAVQRQLATAAQEVRAAQLKLEALQEKWRYATAFCTGGAQRNERVERLTSLLNKHDLRPLEDAEVDSTGKDHKLSVSAASLVKTISQFTPAQKPQLRRIRFQGRYVDVQHALEELTSGETLALPVGLTMKTTDHPELRDWVLLVWI